VYIINQNIKTYFMSICYHQKVLLPICRPQTHPQVQVLRGRVTQLVSLPTAPVVTGTGWQWHQREWGPHQEGTGQEGQRHWWRLKGPAD